jgi:amidohydrolase
MNYKDLAANIEAYIIEQRRWFHQHPELSWEEVETTKEIVRQLEAMGYEVHTYPDRPGCWALLRGGKATETSKTVILRADIDALPVLEKTGLPFASVNEGVMHACGHDCHIAMQLGAAKLLMETKDELEGNVKIFFQAAEETCCRAKYYIDNGILDGADDVEEPTSEPEPVEQAAPASDKVETSYDEVPDITAFELKDDEE